MDKQTLSFQAEVKQILHLVTHSLYSNKEIFLRELVSNASDACDKLRFEAIDNDGLYAGDSDLKIRLTVDREARTIRISDNGVGLSRDEAIANLGTIARSGTREFFSRLTGDAAKDSNLIGQFGVGFYSSFIVAKRVVVESRRAGLPASEGIRWTSEGGGDFTIETLERAERGTDVTLHLRDNEADPDKGHEFDSLLEDYKLRSIVRNYSDHISLPILMKKTQWDKDKQKTVETDEWETVNQARALWLRPKNELTESDYHEFYRHLSNDADAPLAYTHNRVEGRTEYTQLLFVPRRAPFDLWDRQQRHGIRLYVRRVFIMADAEQLMPAYLRFVKGIIDSNDLPLNISREILQESRDVRAIREGSAKRVLSMLEDMAENRKDDFVVFWREFGQVLKEGIGEDIGNQARIAGLLRFNSTVDAPAQTAEVSADDAPHEADGEAGAGAAMGSEAGSAAEVGSASEAGSASQAAGVPESETSSDKKLGAKPDAPADAAAAASEGDKLVALATYKARMKPAQEAIYYVTAETLAGARNSPHLEIFRKKGIEVLLLSDRVDEWMLSFLTEFDGTPLVSFSRGSLDLGKLADEEERKQTEAVAGEFEEVTKRIAKSLGDRVKDVRVTDRLTDSASCLVSAEGDISGTLERLLKQAGQQAPDRKPILEINPQHPLVKQLRAEKTGRFDDWASLLLDQALLAEGGKLDDPSGFVKRMNELLLALTMASR
ncbi:MAG TPA: molecular chaperone HtpG [Lautropia sp.]|nr:molecular chaperone HtpG [Lautropia sp.]